MKQHWKTSLFIPPALLPGALQRFTSTSSFISSGAGKNGKQEVRSAPVPVQTDIGLWQLQRQADNTHKHQLTKSDISTLIHFAFSVKCFCILYTNLGWGMWIGAVIACSLIVVNGSTVCITKYSKWRAEDEINNAAHALVSFTPGLHLQYICTCH